MKRREFLGKMATGSCVLGSYLFPNPLRPRIRLAHASSHKTLVVLFQRGGCDGLNTVIPYQDGDYYALRPTIAIPPPDAANGDSAIDLDGFFGLHPRLAEFEELYDNGDLAILPTVHYPNATRSHFDGQPLIETAAAIPNQGLDGWLNRHLATLQDQSLLPAAGFTFGEHSGLQDSLKGPVIVSSFRNLINFNLGVSATEEIALTNRLYQIYGQGADPTRAHSQLIHNFGSALLDDLATINSLNPSTYTPANGAVYPETPLGRQLKQIAQLIKANVGLQVATVDRHGWDTHRDQGNGNSNGLMSIALAEFSQCISAFYKDLGSNQTGSYMQDVILLTMTEFGRTAAENASFGTDHGNASTWFVLGNQVNGGIYLGSGWPGLANDNLHEERDLEHTIDYRDIYGEILTRHFSHSNLGTLLPGHSYSPIGFLSA